MIGRHHWPRDTDSCSQDRCLPSRHPWYRTGRRREAVWPDSRGCRCSWSRRNLRGRHRSQTPAPPPPPGHPTSSLRPPAPPPPPQQAQSLKVRTQVEMVLVVVCLLAQRPSWDFCDSWWYRKEATGGIGSENSVLFSALVLYCCVAADAGNECLTSCRLYYYGYHITRYNTFIRNCTVQIHGYIILRSLYPSVSLVSDKWSLIEVFDHFLLSKANTVKTGDI